MLMSSETNTNTFRVIGLMSGSSLDGLDIVYTEITNEQENYNYNIVHTACVPYPEQWLSKLKHLSEGTAKEIFQAHSNLGRYYAEKVNEFIIQYKLFGKVDFIASHGHTIFHYPDEDYTCQIGDGAHIAAITGIKTITNFRTVDIAYGGEGTPIVPIGDLLLFAPYKFCLNLGGIANISVKQKNKIIAYDICTANQVLNYYAAQMKMEFDESGNLARKGTLCKELYDKLQEIPYYDKNYPKSLDNSFSRKEIIPMMNQFDISVEEKLHTFTEHIAYQIADEIKRFPLTKEHEEMLVTGGGAFNSFLIECIQKNTDVKLVVPDENLVKYKEALVIALMGVLRTQEKTNVLESVTGAQKDSCGGVIYLP